MGGVTPNPSARVLVVGEVNPFGANPRLALFPRPRQSSGGRLRTIMGLGEADYFLHLDRANLCDGWWLDWKAAEQISRLMMSIVRPGTPTAVVLLGRRVSDAFGSGLSPAMIGIPPFWVHYRHDVTVVTLPHPSGRCRAWNNPGMAEKARILLRSAAPWVPWGSEKKVLSSKESGG